VIFKSGCPEVDIALMGAESDEAMQIILRWSNDRGDNND